MAQSNHPLPVHALDQTVDSALDAGPFRTAEAEPMAIEDIRDALVIRASGAFLLMNKYGDVPLHNESGFGLYRGDTRYLSHYEFQLSGSWPVMLLSTAAPGYAAEQVLTNPSMTSLDGQQLRRESIEVRRQRVLDDGLEETLHITSFHEHAVLLEFRYAFAADFADIFEVRGLTRGERGRLEPAQCGERTLQYGYVCRDGLHLATRIEFSSEPARITDDGAIFPLLLQPGQSVVLALSIRMEQEGTPAPSPRAAGFEHQAQRYQRWRESCTQLTTNNEIFNAVLAQSLNDLQTLWTEDGRGGYLAAGTPWFDTLFGRDSVITGLQTLAFQPNIARQTLIQLAARQGQRLDPWRDEEPGKILHEIRQGEMARLGEVPFDRYYGSIDSTPLFLLLAAEYWAWTADTRLIRELMPAIRRALDWVATYGDLDGDGYLEYEKGSDRGLLNQGWKDSGDAILHRDGSLARQPIALVEVQGYLYAARHGLARLAAARRDARLASRLEVEAQRLRRQVNRDYWLEEGFYALALDGEKQRVDSISSNAGHLLYTGVATPRRGAQVAERLMSPELFSGWGIRTLSAESPRFNPLGYHRGAVWPHDNALAALGLKKYGREAELVRLASALFDAARGFDYYRLPELFCGTPRSGHAAPVPYPVACRPQAWAAGAFPMISQALLGLCPDATRNELLVVRPQLPDWLAEVHVRNLRVGNASVDLLYERRNRRTQVAVLSATAGLRVSVVPRWPLA